VVRADTPQKRLRAPGCRRDRPLSPDGRVRAEDIADRRGPFRSPISTHPGEPAVAAFFAAERAITVATYSDARRTRSPSRKSFERLTARWSPSRTAQGSPVAALWSRWKSR